MRKPKKVIAYVCDIPIPGTEEVISRAEQKARILKLAEREALEIIRFVEDETYTDDYSDRPGVRELLAGSWGAEQVVVDRVWSITRSRMDLEAFMTELDRQGAPLVAASYLWDCLSQQARHRYLGKAARRPLQPAAAAACMAA